MTQTPTPSLACRLLLTLGAALVPVSLAQAQQPPQGGFRAPPPQQFANQPASQTQIANVQQPTTYPMGNFNSNPYLYGGGYGYGGYGGYGGGYYPGQVGGALQGVAAVTSANANYQGTIQNARLQQSYANQSKLDYRRKAIEEWQYEKQFELSPEDIKAKEDAQALRRARSDPPNVEIWAGTSINVIVRSVQRMQLGGLRGPQVPLDSNVTRHVNLTDGTTGGNVGLIRDGKPPIWPLVLKTKDFEEDRKKIDKLTQTAVQQARSGRVGDDTLFSLIDASNKLRDKIDAAVMTLTPTAWVQASRFANELKGTIKALQDPNVAKQFNGQWSVQASNVGELVDQLTRQGLKIAPAAPGDEPYYTSLFNSLISYDMGLNQLVARGPSGGPAMR